MYITSQSVVLKSYDANNNVHNVTISNGYSVRTSHVILGQSVVLNRNDGNNNVHNITISRSKK